MNRSSIIIYSSYNVSFTLEKFQQKDPKKLPILWILKIPRTLRFLVVLRIQPHFHPMPKGDGLSCSENTVTTEKYPFYPFTAASGIWTTPTDLSTLVIEIIHSLQGNSKLKLSQKTVFDMISPQGCSKWTGLGIFLDDSNEKSQIYSLGWGVGFQCMMVCYPYRGNGAVIMTNSDLGVHQMEGIIGKVLKMLSLL